MSNTCYSKTLKVLALTLLCASIVLLVIAIATNHWVHYEIINSKDVSVRYETGLFKTCYHEGDNDERCYDTDKEPILVLRHIGKSDIQICLILCAVLHIVAIFILFNFIIKVRQTFCAAVCCCMVITAVCVTCLVGIIIFIIRTDDDVITDSWEWSFILCCFSAFILMILIFFPFCIHCQNIKENRKVKLPKKYSVHKSIRYYDDVEVGESYVIENKPSDRNGVEEKQRNSEDALKSFKDPIKINDDTDGYHYEKEVRSSVNQETKMGTNSQVNIGKTNNDDDVIFEKNVALNYEIVSNPKPNEIVEINGQNSKRVEVDSKTTTHEIVSNRKSNEIVESYTESSRSIEVNSQTTTTTIQTEEQADVKVYYTDLKEW